MISAILLTLTSFFVFGMSAFCIIDGHEKAVQKSEAKIREDLKDNPEARKLMRAAGYNV